MEITTSEELAILKYQARCEAEMWCKAHDIPTHHIRETEKGFQVTMKFNIGE